MTAAMIRVIDRNPASTTGPRTGHPQIVFREFPDHVAVCVAAIRQRRKNESAVRINGRWQDESASR